MNYNEFIVAIEEYYGTKYSSKLELQLIQKHLQTYDNLQKVFERVIIKHSKKWKSLPDIAIIIDATTASADSIEAEALVAWEQIVNRVNAYTDVICEDPRVQACIVAMGGPVGLANRDPEYETLHRKDFVRLFKLYTENRPSTEIRRLRGYLDRLPLSYIGSHDGRVEIEARVVAQIEDRSDFVTISEALNAAMEDMKI